MAGATQLSRMISRPDPLLLFHWEVKYLPFSEEFGNIDGSYVESFELPFSNVTSGQVFFGGGYNYFPEFHDTSAFTMNFYGDCEGKTIKYLWGWKQKVKSFKTGLYNLPSEYKKDITVMLRNPKGETVLEVTYLGCWPSDTAQIGLDYASNDRVIIPQTFSLDSMDIKFFK